MLFICINVFYNCNGKFRKVQKFQKNLTNDQGMLNICKIIITMSRWKNWVKNGFKSGKAVSGGTIKTFRQPAFGILKIIELESMVFHVIEYNRITMGPESTN